MQRIPSSQSQQEKAAGRKAAKQLRPSVLRTVQSVFNRQSGDLANARTGIATRRGTGELRGVTLSMPAYGFILHHGFSGRKSNGVFQRLKKTEWIQEAIDRSGAVESLANEISEIRATAFETKIQF